MFLLGYNLKIIVQWERVGVIFGGDGGGGGGGTKNLVKLESSERGAFF